MPRYIIERDVGDVSEEELQAVGKKSLEVVDSMSDVTWIRSYISAAEGKIYCEYDAPNPEALQEHARRTGIPANRISEISIEVNPAMFR